MDEIRNAIENSILANLSSGGDWIVEVGDKEVEFRIREDGLIVIRDELGEPIHLFSVQLLAESLAE